MITCHRQTGATMSTTPVDGFTKLTDSISLHRPSTTAADPQHPSTPAFIVICSWFAAAPKHIAKYT